MHNLWQIFAPAREVGIITGRFFPKGDTVQAESPSSIALLTIEDGRGVIRTVNLCRPPVMLPNDVIEIAIDDTAGYIAYSMPSVPYLRILKYLHGEWKIVFPPPDLSPLVRGSLKHLEWDAGEKPGLRFTTGTHFAFVCYEWTRGFMLQEDD